jgi:hypothetical protein
MSLSLALSHRGSLCLYLDTYVVLVLYTPTCRRAKTIWRRSLLLCVAAAIPNSHYRPIGLVVVAVASLSCCQPSLVDSLSLSIYSSFSHIQYQYQYIQTTSTSTMMQAEQQHQTEEHVQEEDMEEVRSVV